MIELKEAVFWRNRVLFAAEERPVIGVTLDALKERCLKKYFHARFPDCTPMDDWASVLVTCKSAALTDHGAIPTHLGGPSIRRRSGAFRPSRLHRQGLVHVQCVRRQRGGQRANYRPAAGADHPGADGDVTR